MSFSAASPQNYGFEGDPLLEAYMNAKFSEEISEKMKVPKRITANGMEIGNHEILNGNETNSWNYYEKLDMTVPDRIVVMGQDQHLGTRSAPREIMLDNSILPKDPGFIRVSTPPRVITLSSHHFPAASDDLDDNEDDSRFFEPKTLNFAEETKRNNRNIQKQQNSQEMVINNRDDSQQFGSGVGSVENLSTAHDEVLHLRKQVAKLNRRLLNVEIDNLQRAQREKIMLSLGVAYFLLKAVLWLNRK